MGKARSAAVAAIVSSFLVAGGTPALADEGDPLVLTSTGLTEGQPVGPLMFIHPTWTGPDVVKIQAINGSLISTTTHPAAGLRVPFTAAQDGQQVPITVRVSDAAGESAESTTTVLIDRTSPTATLAPAAGTLQRGTFTVTASDVSDDVAQMALAGPDDTRLVTVTEAPWTITYNSVGGPSAVHVILIDQAGNGIAFPSYSIDNQPPTIGAPDFFGRPVGRAKGLTQIDFPFSDGSGVDRDEFLVDGVVVQSRPAPDPSNTTRISGDILTYDFGATARTATVEARAWDRAGNESTRTLTVVVDAAGPTITSISPASNTWVVRGSRINTSVRATDPSGILDASLNNAYFASDPNHLALSVPAGADGRKTLTWRVHDRFYNTTTITRYLTVDNTRPTLKITKGPKNKAKVKGTVRLAAAATDRNGVARLELLINGKIVARTVKASYNFAINTKKYGKTVKVQIRAYDRAGNATTTTTRTWHR